jgi:glycosyltransferase involved in cell wall biosynthesis
MAVPGGCGDGRAGPEGRGRLMARVLVLCGSYPADLSSGAELRFWNLCREIAARNDCYLVCFGGVPDGIDPRSHIGVVDCRTLPEIPAQGLSFMRHLRLTNTRYLESSAPRYLDEVRATITGLAQEWQIDVLVCLVPPAAEVLMHIELPKLLDFCDSRTLTLRRMLRNPNRELSLRARFDIHLRYFRQRRSERQLVQHFDRTTTISDADRDSFLEVSGAHPGKVVVIPNGVSVSALQQSSKAGPRNRTVVFWGNLDFPPNWTAVDYFNRKVFLPHLANSNVEWHIIGRGADDAIRDLAKHPLVHLHGFVDDLYAEIASHGVMVNPMVEGSGLKNKVLEAFACHLPVVSTSMGIEAVGARANEHYLQADDPAEFASAIIRCLDDADFSASMTTAARQFVEGHFEWGAIGEKLNGILAEITS